MPKERKLALIKLKFYKLVGKNESLIVFLFLMSFYYCLSIVKKRVGVKLNALFGCIFKIFGCDFLWAGNVMP